MNAPKDQELELFSQALEITDGKRFAFLHEVCGEDTQLRERIIQLLEASGEEAHNDLLEPPRHRLDLFALPKSPNSDLRGQVLGDYEIIKLADHMEAMRSSIQQAVDLLIKVAQAVHAARHLPSLSADR